MNRLFWTLMSACLLVLTGCGSDDSDAATSLEWSRVDLDQEVFGEASGPMLSVTAGGPGLVAVGFTQVDNAPVWTSPDGLDWTPVPLEESPRLEPGLTSVTAGGPGFVAVGYSYGAPAAVKSGGLAVVWTSPDGTSWSNVSLDEDGFADAGMLGVTSGGPGVVAVGFAMDHAAVWTSTDGITWSPVPHDESIFGRDDTQMSAVTGGGPGLIAVGSRRGPGPDHASVWTSSDGIAWSPVPHDEDVFADVTQMSSVVAGGPGVVAVGTAGDDAAVWTSTDGITWSRVLDDQGVFGGQGDQAMAGVTNGGPGLVAVGSDGTNAAVWTSVDGVAWSRTPHDEDVFGGPADQAMRSVTTSSTGLVAVGLDDPNLTVDSAAVWVAEG